MAKSAARADNDWYNGRWANLLEKNTSTIGLGVELCDMLTETVDVDTSSRGWSPCRSKFADGHCDSECDDERSQFDGFDCAVNTSPHAAAAAGDAECDEDTRSRPKTSRRPQCSLVYADGTCDPDCDSAACLWDGGDCTNTALRLLAQAVI